MECIKSKLKWDYESDASSSDDHKVAVFTEFDAVAWFHISETLPTSLICLAI